MGVAVRECVGCPLLAVRHDAGSGCCAVFVLPCQPPRHQATRKRQYSSCSVSYCTLCTQQTQCKLCGVNGGVKGCTVAVGRVDTKAGFDSRGYTHAF